MLKEFLINWFARSGELPNRFTIKMGEKIRQGRLEAGLSQADLAEFIYSRQAAVSAIENGKMEVSASQLVSLCGALEKPITYFFPEEIAGKIAPENVSLDEMELLVMVRNLSEDDLAKLKAQVRGLLTYQGL